MFQNTVSENWMKHEMRKITHMWRRWATPQNFCLAFIDKLEKQLLKKLLKWANKKCKKFIIFNVVFSLKNKEKPGSWDTEWDRHKFLSFWAIFSIMPPPPPLTIHKIIENFENMKKSIWKWNSSFTCRQIVTTNDNK